MYVMNTTIEGFKLPEWRKVYIIIILSILISHKQLSKINNYIIITIGTT